MVAGSRLSQSSSGGQGRGGVEARFVGEREDLKAGAVEGDEVLVDERVAGAEVALQRDLQQRADRIVVIEAQAVAVGGEHQQHVEAELVGGERGEEAVAQEAMRQEGKALAADGAHALRAGWARGG